MNGVGQKLVYVYFEDEPGRRSAAKLLSKDCLNLASNYLRSAFIEHRECVFLALAAD